jgi:outer membrane protein OmpA-like peptidoglycan-associated protein
MKCSQITGSALAVLFIAACGANERHAISADRAAQQAEEDKREAQEEAREAHQQTVHEQREAQEAAQAERGAERNAQWATQRATLAEAQAAREAQSPPPRSGAAEAQGSSAGTVGDVKAVVLFAPGRRELSAEAKVKLDEVAAAVRARGPERRVIVEGYADDTGPDATNVELSQRRADEVADYLENRGVARDRITMRGLGSRHPAGSDETERGRALNRRVEVVVQPR